MNIRNGQSGAQTDVIVDANDRIIASINQLQTGALKSVSNDIEAADTAPGKVKALSSQLAALADEAKKAGGFQQAFGPLGDILDVGSVKGITQEQESRVSPGTPVGKPAATHTAALLMAL